MLENYETFNEIKDSVLRARNRAIVMANIFEDHSKGNDITTKGASLLFRYFESLPKMDIALTFEAFKADMEARGYRYGS